MKKKIALLGSTGSIGLNTLKIIKKNKKNYKVVLLSTNSNISKILNQAKEFNVKNLIINDFNKYNKAKAINKSRKFNIFNSFDEIKLLFKNKEIDYSMVAVSGLDGLKPSIILSKYTKTLAIVNKESIICGWNLIKKNLKKFNTTFIPIDSEHYSIFSLLKNHKIEEVEKIYITASGGPFLNFSQKQFTKIKLNDALKHPNWKMGKKITIDSATLMNKVFEVVEAKKIFDTSYNKIKILTHPNSYIHAILKFKNGLIKIVAHEPDMKIPIFNSIYQNKKFQITKKLNIKALNKLNFKEVNTFKFPSINLLKNLPEKDSLYETVLISINDYFVDYFLSKKINFNQLNKLIIKWSKHKEFQKYKKIRPINLNQIYKLRDYVSFKINSSSI